MPWCPWRPEEAVGAPGTRVTDNCEPLLCGCWESKLSPQEEEAVSLVTETAVQPLKVRFKVLKTRVCICSETQVKGRKDTALSAGAVSYHNFYFSPFEYFLSSISYFEDGKILVFFT